MYKLLIAVVVFCVTACAPTIKSVVGEEVGKKVYKNTLIVIPYVNPAAEEPSNKLKNNLETLFNADGHKVEVIVFEQKQEELALNSKSDITARITEKIAKEEKDLVIIFRTKTIGVSHGVMQSITYMVAATDPSKMKEIWKAECENDSFFSPADFGKKAATVIYNKLKSDKVL